MVEQKLLNAMSEILVTLFLELRILACLPSVFSFYPLGFLSLAQPGSSYKRLPRPSDSSTQVSFQEPRLFAGSYNYENNGTVTITFLNYLLSSLREAHLFLSDYVF